MNDELLRELVDLRRRVERLESIETASFAASAVQSPTLLNGWGNFGGGFTDAGYWQDPLGMVWVQGVIKNGTVPATAFVLPVGYRPAAGQVFSTISNGGLSRIDITSTGQVVVSSGNSGYVSLSIPPFRAA